MRAVNLLPRDASQAKSIRNEDPAVVIGSVFGVLVIIALSAGFLTAHSRASAEQTKLTAAQIELGKLSLRNHPIVAAKPVKPTKPIIAIPAVTSEEQPRLQAIAGALSTRIAWDRILREFSLVVPDDVSIASLNMTAPVDPASGSATASGQTFVISGSAYSHDSVARLLTRLMLIPDLTAVTLASSSAAATGSTSSVQFAINATIKGGPVPVAATPPAVTTTTDTTTGAG